MLAASSANGHIFQKEARYLEERYFSNLTNQISMIHFGVLEWKNRNKKGMLFKVPDHFSKA